jgi:DNA-binding beta-propeller fold protein YncE
MTMKTFAMKTGGLALLVALLGGCATQTTTEKPASYTFFPPPPDEPRVQFLMAFASDADLGRSGGFAEFITGEEKKANPLIKPYGLATYGGKIFVCDTMAGVIQVFDLQSQRASYFAPAGEGQLKLPINITIDEDGSRYVADTGRNAVLIYDSNGGFRAAIGQTEELRPSDVALTADRIYLADLKAHTVRVYGKADRKLLFTIPVDGQPAQGKLFSPTNLAVDRQGGRLLVTDTGGFVVQVYDLDGKYLRTIGGQGTAPGLFALPKGVAVDHAGLAYVVDARTQLVQIFDPEGKALMYFGYPGESARGDLVLPAAVKIDYDDVPLFQKYVAPGYQCDYLILVTSQFGDKKVSVYGFLKKA